MTFSNISVITEDIYLKSSCLLSKREPIPVGEVILHFFLTKLCPFFDLEFSKCSYSRAFAPACGVPVIHTVFKEVLLDHKLQSNSETYSSTYVGAGESVSVCAGVGEGGEVL